MTIKTILCAASGGTASEGAIELACRMAKRLGAHLEGFHVRLDPRELLVSMSADGYPMSMVGVAAWLDQVDSGAAELSAKTKAAFDAAVARNELPTASGDRSSAAWREETGYGPVRVAERARFFDLAVLGRSERVVEKPHSDAVEETLLQSGRPVLLAPANPPTTCGEVIAIGWNGSVEAVRALTASLPLLAAAKTVALVTIGDHGIQASVAPMLDYLLRHGATAKHRHADPISGVGAGQQLLGTARDAGADLLVMGAYSRMPWRELLFGGATREIVGVSLLPVLLSN